MKQALGAGLAAAALAFAVVALGVGIHSGSEGDDDAAAADGASRSEHRSGHAVFARMGCGSCHTLAAAGSRGQIGPNLDARLAHHTRASLIARITAPPSDPEGFSMMPTDFASRMDVRELDALVRFLLAAR
jgi:mono/diheme cytochrome c family protein